MWLDIASRGGAATFGAAAALLLNTAAAQRDVASVATGAELAAALEAGVRHIVAVAHIALPGELPPPQLGTVSIQVCRMAFASGALRF